MEVGIDLILLISQRFWHVVVDDDVDLFHINTSSEQISGDQDSAKTFLELLVSLNSSKDLVKGEIGEGIPILDVQVRVYGEGGEVALSKDLVELNGSFDL